MSTSITPQLFRTRFALAPFSDGGIVVDLSTGSYSRLNLSATVMCAALERAETFEEAVAQASERLGVSRSVVSSGLTSLASALDGEGIRQEPPDPFRYRSAEGGGYDLWHGPLHVLHVDERGDHLRLVAPLAELPLRPYDYVSAVAPKVLFLRGVTVLHGSSCLLASSSSLIAICGKSRAGKTTTGRTLAKYTRGSISEDLLVLAPDLSKPEAYADGEANVHRWSIEASEVLAAGGKSTVDCAPLTGASSGRTIPIEAVWFVDARRRGETFAVRALRRADALALLIANHFLGASGAANWRRHLAASHSIASAVGAYELDLPLGLERLDQAIARYMTNSAS